ncbi:MAG: carbonate dehydratase [Burkholderiales bacterium PBB3]|nr:MAG: carbonate dehydratase [Burkholderiales bacterium PBB3]
MKTLLLAATLLTTALTCAWADDKAAAAHGTAPHWSYTGPAGAIKWGELQKDFATCKLGTKQSPIDIKGAAKGNLPAIGFNYGQTTAEVVNNGHTIQVNLAGGGDVKVASGGYKLLQFHFHTPSEEKINGKPYPMVAHLVHKSDAGKLAVVAVLFKEGKKNEVLEKVFAAMPAKADGKVELAGGVNVANLLPTKRAYWAFEGSLTTPPCSEEVQWHVLKDPVEMSKTQLAAFKKLYPMNARPVQPLNGRSLQESAS